MANTSDATPTAPPTPAATPAGSSLGDYYRRWEAKAKRLSVLDDDAAPVGAAGVVSDWANLRPEDIGVHIGRPLTEAEFAVHRASGAQVVTRRAAP
jgi:hypothetical protein